MKEVRKMKFLKVQNNSDSTDIYIKGVIEDDSWKCDWFEDESTYPSDIRDMLKDAKGDVNVYINSGGGDMFAGVAISNMLKRYEGKTTAHVDGLAGSAASIIAFGCNEIEMPKNSYLMIHKPLCAVYGNSDDFLKMADTLDTLQEGLVETYLSKAKEETTKEQINQMINNETWLTGSKASEFFNVRVSENEAKIDNKVLGKVYNEANIPEQFLNTNDTSEAEELEKMQQEIEIALNL